MNLPSSPEDRKQILQVLQEISNSMTRAEAERDYIKEAVKDVCTKYELPKKEFRKMARVYHKQNFTEEVQSADTFQTMYETLTGQTTI